MLKVASLEKELTNRIGQLVELFKCDL